MTPQLGLPKALASAASALPPQAEHLNMCPKLTVLNVSGIVSTAIKRIHNERADRDVWIPATHQAVGTVDQGTGQGSDQGSRGRGGGLGSAEGWARHLIT